MTGNMRRIDHCYGGQVTKFAAGQTVNGFPYAGTFLAPCEKCGGKGCAKDGGAALAAATDGLTDRQKFDLAAAIEQIVGPAT